MRQGGARCPPQAPAALCQERRETGTNEEDMVRLPDTHTHTRFSDGEGELIDNIRRAAALGLPTIACTDHMALREPPPGLTRPADAPAGRQTDWHMAWEDLPHRRDRGGACRLPGHRGADGAGVQYWPDVEGALRSC